MKKLFVILIALALLVGWSVPAFAGAGTLSFGGGVGLGTLRSVTCINNTTSTVQTVIPTAITSWQTATGVFQEPGVTPGKVKILGYDCSVINNTTMNTGIGWVSLIDATAFTSNSGDIFAEAEATLATPVGKIFPAGMNLQFGLVVDQGPYTTVTIYYVQDQG